MIDPFKTKGSPDDETLFVMRDPDQLYTHSEIVDLLQKAEDMGFDLERGCMLEKLIIRELDVLVNRRQ